MRINLLIDDNLAADGDFSINYGAGSIPSINKPELIEKLLWTSPQLECWNNGMLE